MAGLRQRLSNLFVDLVKMQGCRREVPAAAGRGREQQHGGGGCRTHGGVSAAGTAAAVQTV